MGEFFVCFFVHNLLTILHVLLFHEDIKQFRSCEKNTLVLDFIHEYKDIKVKDYEDKVPILAHLDINNNI